MTRATQRLEARLHVETINPKIAIRILLNGLLTDDEIATFRPANVTVESLVKLLSSPNAAGRNRKISIPHVLKLARDMAHQNWKFTGDPIKIDDAGVVMDGQHRLLAVIRSNTTQRFAVLSNADHEVQLVTDIGRGRTARDQLAIRNASNATNAAAGAKLVLRWRSGMIMDSRYQPSITEVVHFVLENPVITDACSRVMKIRTQLSRAPMSALVAAYVEASAIDTNARDYFFDKLTYGDGLPQRDPILTLRNTFARHARTRQVPQQRQLGHLFMIVYSWNKFRAGESTQTLRVPPTLTSNTFPTMK
jgi:hypothetical protein